jgi:hypothetical protein
VLRTFARSGTSIFRSLRLSVRTPPFHGGESGSIPLGSANEINGLSEVKIEVSNGCPIYRCGHQHHEV